MNNYGAISLMYNFNWIKSFHYIQALKNSQLIKIYFTFVILEINPYRNPMDYSFPLFIIHTFKYNFNLLQLKKI